LTAAFPSVNLPYIEEKDTVSGAIHAENLRHLSARTQFLGCLCEDARVLATMNTWAEQTGLIAAAEEVAARLDRIAEDLGLEHRSEL
jgi:hypothetical protein